MKRFGPCTGRYCQMQAGYDVKSCKLETCRSRTELSFELYKWITEGLLIESALGTSLIERFENIETAVAETKQYFLHENMTEV